MEFTIKVLTNKLYGCIIKVDLRTKGRTKMLKGIAKGYKRLKDEEKHWNDEVKFYPSFENLQAHRNAIRALREFSETYKSQLQIIKKNPFLAR